MKQYKNKTKQKQNKTKSRTLNDTNLYTLQMTSVKLGFRTMWGCEKGPVVLLFLKIGVTNWTTCSEKLNHECIPFTKNI